LNELKRKVKVANQRYTPCLSLDKQAIKEHKVDFEKSYGITALKRQTKELTRIVEFISAD